MSKDYNLEVDNNGFAVQVARLSNSAPIYASATVSSSAATSLNSHTMFRVTSDNNVYLRFGDETVVAAINAATNMLFLAGTEILIVPRGATHFAAIRAGGSDALVQFIPIND